MLRVLVVLALLAWFGGSNAADHDYRLEAREIFPGSFVVPGTTEHFRIPNGGNIVNTAFFETSSGVVVIDTGPTALYGAQLRRLIEATCRQPIVRVYNTHHHPDHFFGNQAFADVPIYALPATRREMEAQAEAFSDNLYRLLGTWMKGTVPHLPTVDTVPGEDAIGDHVLEIYAFQGHTAGDLAIFDRTSRVLYAGDLVFNNRAPTMPHASIDPWLTSLAGLRGINFRWLVPGHGAPTESTAAVSQTADYLRWLQARIDDAVSGGYSMAETLYLPVPERFAPMDTLVDEYRRSVMQLFRPVEHAYFHGEGAP